MLERARNAWSAAALVLFLTLIVSDFVAPWLAHDIWTYICEPYGAFIVARWVARWTWRRFQAAPGLRGFIPHKTPWAP